MKTYIEMFGCASGEDVFVDVIQALDNAYIDQQMSNTR